METACSVIKVCIRAPVTFAALNLLSELSSRSSRFLLDVLLNRGIFSYYDPAVEQLRCGYEVIFAGLPEVVPPDLKLAY